jgi:hypothetical protein
LIEKITNHVYLTDIADFMILPKFGLKTPWLNAPHRFDSGPRLHDFRRLAIQDVDKRRLRP